MRFRSASPVAADPFRLSGGVGLNHGTSRSAVPRIRVDFGAELGSLSLPLGLHAPIDRLHVDLRQVDALDANIDDLDAELCRLLVD
jgi:hypothetical protein